MMTMMTVVIPVYALMLDGVLCDSVTKTKNQKPKTKNQKPKTKNQKPKTKNQKPKTKNQKPKTKNQKPKNQKTKKPKNVDSLNRVRLH
jgi:hypothetical protein